MISIDELRDKYLEEIKKQPDTDPIKDCLKLIYDAATTKDPSNKLEVSRKLANFLMEERGVLTLFLAVVDFDASSQKVTTLNRRFLAIASMIADLPHLDQSYKLYCTSILDQLKYLVIHSKQECSSLACLIMKSFSESKRGSAEYISRDIVTQIVSPLIEKNCQFYKPLESIIASHNLLSNNYKVNNFVPYFSNFFFILCHLYNTPSRLKQIIVDILIRIMASLKQEKSCIMLKDTLFHKKATSLLYDVDHTLDDISIKLVDQDDSVVVDKTFIFDEFTVEKIKKVCKILLDKIRDEKYKIEFLFQFQESMWIESNDVDRELSASVLEPFIDMESGDGQQVLSSIMANIDQSINLICLTLSHFKTYLINNPSDSGEKKLSKKHKSISLSLNILDVLCALASSQHSRDIMKTRVLNILVQLKETVIEYNIDRDRSSDTSEWISNLDIIIDKIQKKFSGQDRVESNQSTFNQDREMSNLLEDFNSELVPCRVHALVKLKLRIQENNKFYVDRIIHLFSIVDMCLADNDSYVFLACINLLAEMVLHKTDEILPRLIELYTDESLCLQHRLNVGEILVRLSKRLNKMGPYYSKQIINPFFKIFLQDDREEMRSSSSSSQTDLHQDANVELMKISSLVNLGEICRTLGNELGMNMAEIMTLVKGVLDSNTSTIALKCASIDLLRSCLAGVDISTIKSIELDIKNIYKTLNLVRKRSLDDKLDLQAQLALDEISRIAKDLIVGDVQKKQESLLKSIDKMKILKLNQR